MGGWGRRRLDVTTWTHIVRVSNDDRYGAKLEHGVGADELERALGTVCEFGIVEVNFSGKGRALHEARLGGRRSEERRRKTSVGG